MQKNRGFSLIELMVVISIIAILSVIGLNGYSSAVRKGRDARRKSDVNAIAQALSLYRMDKNEYPSKTNYENGDFLDYIKKNQLCDPSSKGTAVPCGDNPYIYVCWTGAGATAKCKSFLVCAKVEEPGNANFEFDIDIRNYGIKGQVPAGGPASLTAAGHSIPPNPSGTTDNWYCVSSI
jgi:prepilin-type N-terminal cleavage/methylation domain-containing protein